MGRNLIRLCFLICSSLISINCHATGLGFSLGDASEDWDDVSTVESRNLSSFGFVVDTTVAGDQIFNYRFSLLKEENNSDGNGINMDGITFLHNFGFGVLRNKHVRLWLGPELRTAFYEDLSIVRNGSRVQVPGDVWGYGIGIAMGANFHLPEVASIGISASYYVFNDYTGDYDSTSTDLDIDSSGLYLNLTVLFRVNDEF